MDPFAQKILSFPQRSVPGQLATVGRVQDYAGPSKTYYKADGTLDRDSIGIRQPFAGCAHFPQTMFSNDPTFNKVDNVGDTVVVDCAFYFCVQTFKVEVNSGKLSVEAFNSWYNESGDGPSNYLTPPTRYVPQGSVLNYTFNPVPLLKYFQTQLARPENNVGTDLLSQLSLAENITGMVSNVGQSMTAALMNVGDLKQQGTSFTTEVFIHVHWPWIILPAMLVLSTAATLLLMIFQTWSNKMAIWKTSNMALVFHSAELSDRGSSAYNSATEMNNKATSIKTELVSRDMKWQFIRR
ncbi:MAG: hypothetical protein L6R37_003662 [Teloschistes peruensis]|nr:MAG: hypothetical protein L6R37_003662 [Teloschistes peruensis]